MSKKSRDRGPAPGASVDGERPTGTPGKVTRTQALPPAAGASVHRVTARPSPGRFKPTELGQSRHDVVTLTNVSDEPVDFFDFLETVLQVDGTERPPGDFAVVGGTTTGKPLAPGASMPVTVAFTPHMSHPLDARRRGTRRASRFAVVDFDGATAGTIELEGRAIPPRDAEAAEEREEIAEVSSSVRHAERELSPPRTYEDMLRHLQAARELMLTEERAEAGQLVEGVRAYMRERLDHDDVFRAYREHGLGREAALRSVGEVRDRLDSVARAAATPDWRVNLDTAITAFQAAQEPIQYVLGERDDSPGIRALHDAAPVVLAGRAAEELGETAVDVLTDATFAAGFGLGVMEGATSAVTDLATGAAEVLALALDIVKALVTGGLIGAAESAAAKLSDFFSKAPAALNAMGVAFEQGWNAPGSFARGNFRGEVIGYIATQIAIVIISGGAAAEAVAFASLSRWGKLVAIIQKLDAAGDIAAWASKAGKGLRIADELLAKLRRAPAASGHNTHVDAPSNDGPRNHDGHEPSAAGPASRPEPEADTPVDRTGPPYEDPRVDERGPRRPLDRRELRPYRGLDAKSSWKEVEKAQRRGETSFAIGRKLKTAEQGHELLARLAKGDSSALKDLGIDDAPVDLDSTGREWALVQTRDGFAMYAGEYNRVQFPVELRVLGHTHPGPKAGLPNDAPAADRALRGDDGGMTFDEIVMDLENARQSGILPSAADINAISDGTAHVLYTRFVHNGDGKIENPRLDDARPRVQVQLTNARVIRWNERTRSYWYEVRASLRDSNGKELWSGSMFASHHAFVPGSGQIFVHKPPALTQAPPPGWREP